MIILWIALFLLILAISFVLAYSSMKDYQLTPPTGKSDDYALYLIRNPSSININFLSILHKNLQDQSIISFERLFRRVESALVVFGPKILLKPLTEQLSLMELESYTEVDKDQVYAWEVGMKDEKKFLTDQRENIFANFPQLIPQEQFFWQIVISKRDEDGFFMTQIRAVFVSDDAQRRKEIGETLQDLNPYLIKLPKEFSSTQILEFYKKRSLNKEKTFPLSPASVNRLLKL